MKSSRLPPSTVGDLVGPRINYVRLFKEEPFLEFESAIAHVQEIFVSEPGETHPAVDLYDLLDHWIDPEGLLPGEWSMDTCLLPASGEQHPWLVRSAEGFDDVDGFPVGLLDPACEGCRLLEERIEYVRGLPRHVYEAGRYWHLHADDLGYPSYTSAAGWVTCDVTDDGSSRWTTSAHQPDYQVDAPSWPAYHEAMRALVTRPAEVCEECGDKYDEFPKRAQKERP